MALHASAVSLREAMEKMSGLPDLPGGARPVILVRALRVRDAPQALRAIAMRGTTWRGRSLNAVRRMADAYVLLNPHDKDAGFKKPNGNRRFPDFPPFPIGPGR
jgi:hypothetical protein